MRTARPVEPTWWQVLLVALTALVMLGVVPGRCAAQSAGSIWLGRTDEFVAGAAGNLFLRGPWVAKGWRKPLPRAVLWHAVSFGYERFGDASHAGRFDAQALKDFMGREGGYFAAELVIALIRRKL